MMVKIYRDINNGTLLNGNDPLIPVPFVKSDYRVLQKCLKEGWDSLSVIEMSPSLRPAYSTLFMHM
jgi:hypothetical protein